MADESFFESPWIQIGAPLAAAALGVADRTRSGRISQASGMGSSAFTGYGEAQRKKRLAQVVLDKEAKDKQAFKDSLDAYGKGDDPSTPEGPAPEGGGAPEADANNKTEALEAAVAGVPAASVPSPNFQFRGNERQELELVNEVSGSKAARERLVSLVGERHKEKAPTPQANHYTNITNEYNDQVLDIYNPNDHSQTQRYMGGAPPKEFSGGIDAALMSKDPDTVRRAEGAIRTKERLTPPQPKAPPNPDTGEETLRAAIGEYRRNNPDATAADVSQAAHLMKTGVNTTDLDTISDMLGKGEPDSLIRLQDAVGRGGAPVRSYILGRTKRKYPEFDPAGVDRKITMLGKYANPEARPGRQMIAYGTFLRHAAAAAKVVKKYETSGVPLANRTISWVRKNVAGDPELSDLLAAISPVKYEYAVFVNGGYALTDHDKQEADELYDPMMGTVGMMMTTISRMGETVAARTGEMNHFYKREVGSDIPDMLSPSAIAAGAAIGVHLGRGDNEEQQDAAPAPADRRSAVSRRKDDAAQAQGGQPSGKPIGAATGRPNGPATLKNGQRVIVKDGLAYAAP